MDYITAGDRIRTDDVQLGKIPKSDRKTVRKPCAFSTLAINEAFRKGSHGIAFFRVISGYLNALGGREGRGKEDAAQVLPAPKPSLRLLKYVDKRLRTEHPVALLMREDEVRPTQRIMELAAAYGRVGTPRITELIRNEGILVNHRWVERIRKAEGLKVLKKRPQRERSWLNDGRSFWMQTLVDECTRACLALDVARRLRSDDVLERLSWLFGARGYRRPSPRGLRTDRAKTEAGLTLREGQPELRAARWAIRRRPKSERAFP